MADLVAASAFSWWQDAGVDTFVAEAPHDWLSEPPTPAAVSGAIPADQRLPDRLAEFQAWLLASDAVPLAATGAPRVGPSGDPGSGLMVLVDMPSPEDVAAGRLLSGAPGELFERMMAAIDRDRDTLYLASLAPARIAAGRLDDAGAAALARIARHHVGLARPRALLLFGDACAKALLGGPVARMRGGWRELDTAAGPVRTIATLRPEKLLGQPNLKKHAWEDLQRLKEGLEP